MAILIGGAAIVLGARVASRWPDAIPIALVVIAVIGANGLYLVGVFDPNPLYRQSGLVARLRPGWLPGLETIDPNAGFVSQALGHRAVLEWLAGRVPWWNPYEGVGAPLAGEMNCAALFPLVALLRFPSGQVALFTVLEIIAGVATYGLLRTLSLHRAPALAGAIAFALNGTFAWFRYSPSNPIAFLPLLLLGVERAFEATRDDKRSGYTLVAVAVALSLYSGFPETAFLDGLLAGAWVIARAVALGGKARARFLAKVTGGALTGVLLGAPVVVPFLDYLSYGDIGGHAGALARAHLQREAIPMLLLPYVYGPIFAFYPYDSTSTLMFVWSNVGGYLTTSVVTLALLGALGRRESALRIGLLVWILAALGKMYGVAPVTIAMNVLPGVPAAAFYRYAWPSLSMAVIVLASFGFDDMVTGEATRRRIAGATSLAIVLTVVMCVCAIPELHRLGRAPSSRTWALASAAWAGTLVVVTGAAALALRRTARAAVIATLVALDACTLFVVPELSAPRGGIIDTTPVAFLRAHLGTYRFYTLGPIQPNYGSYFGIASINVNDTPIPKAWSSYIAHHLDPGANPMLFTGTHPQNPSARPTAAENFLEHFEAYQDVGVKFLVTPAGSTLPTGPASDELRLVFSDAVAAIYELPRPRPYFEALDDGCTLEAGGRDEVRASCPRAARLVRRELFMPGWKASVDGRVGAVKSHGPLFQALDLPAGEHVVRYEYVPPYLGFGVVAFASGVLILAAGATRRRRTQVASAQLLAL